MKYDHTVKHTSYKRIFKLNNCVNHLILTLIRSAMSTDDIPLKIYMKVSQFFYDPDVFFVLNKLAIQ